MKLSGNEITLRNQSESIRVFSLSISLSLVSLRWKIFFHRSIAYWQWIKSNLIPIEIWGLAESFVLFRALRTYLRLGKNVQVRAGKNTIESTQLSARLRIWGFSSPLPSRGESLKVWNCDLGEKKNQILNLKTKIWRKRSTKCEALIFKESCSILFVASF